MRVRLVDKQTSVHDEDDGDRVGAPVSSCLCVCARGPVRRQAWTSQHHHGAKKSLPFVPGRYVSIFTLLCVVLLVIILNTVEHARNSSLFNHV